MQPEADYKDANKARSVKMSENNTFIDAKKSAWSLSQM